ncbi:hypothetical protein IQ268_26480 [Oculatella sp. LEGE 06141]|uniref:C45 family autoproteolytic acyltransferase/hydolase n=1 Tax=Oculatella sp. LEGE 06141 TaxID=1828648 RepID=UPI001880A551|nr:C45 family peptidase [Oculatella sp. LEGE 06141]MBE9182118.1 hypothetical protein [Oculatella sp. LEGE 06141]
MQRRIKRWARYHFGWLMGVVCLFVLAIAVVLHWQRPLNAQPTESIPPIQVSQPFQLQNWQPVPAHRADRGNVKVVWLQGTPYEMGYQHGTLLHDEIASMGAEAIRVLNFAGRGLGLARLARNRSYPGVLDECRGLAAATDDIGLTIDGCMSLAFGDVYQEFFTYVLPNFMFNDGCAQFVAAGAATVDGRLYHGGTLDNNGEPIDYWLNNSTVFVRQPNDGIPYVSIVVPGMIWPNSGINAAGLSIALNTAHVVSAEELDLDGRSNVQLMSRILHEASSFEEASALMESETKMISNLITITDGNARRAGVFEFTGQNMAVRELDENGLVYVTNHFVSPEMEDKDREPTSASSLNRYNRLQQLLEPGAVSSRYGDVDPAVAVEILRDRTNPNTLRPSPLDVYDDDASIGGNGSLRQMVFDPEKKLFWVAAGAVPVPENPFVCFSLDEMLGLPNAAPCEAPMID